MGFVNSILSSKRPVHAPLESLDFTNTCGVKFFFVNYNLLYPAPGSHDSPMYCTRYQDVVYK
jgi:hypothetical protein